MRLGLLIGTAALLISCNRDTQNGKLFTLMEPARTKIDFVNQLTETEEINIIEYLYFNNGAGVGAGDINNDGLVDLFFTANQLENKLYLNKGDLQFEDITNSSGTSGAGDWKTGVSMADVNGDGWLDIYVCQVGDYKDLHGKNQLFINQGDLTFKEEAASYGLDFCGFSTHAAFLDYDTDGDLDMFLLNHSVHTSRSYGRMDLRFDDDPMAGDKLYRNDLAEGKTRFTDVTREAGIYTSQIGYGLGVSICDINNDGYPDIYVSNDFHENDYLYINNGNATFTESLTRCMGQTSRSSMGNDAADFNNDGLIDIVVLDMLPDDQKIRQQSGGEDDFELSMIKKQYGYNEQFVRNTLQLNLGGELFSEIGQLAGISATDWSWSPLFCDMDNDGWKDLFITSGIFHRANDLDYIRFLTGGNRFQPAKDNSNLSDKDLYDKMPLFPNINYAFRNNGDLTFTDVSPGWGFSDKAFSNGSAFADLDNDGDADLVVNNINSPASVYKNNASDQGNHYLAVRLKGPGLNTRATGARLILYSQGRKQSVEQFTTRGFMSSSSDVLHFGLGKEAKVDSLVIRWPDLSETRILEIGVDTIITLEYSSTPHALQSTASDPAGRSRVTHGQKSLRMTDGWFRATRIPGLEYVHKEDDWSEFTREKLLPHSLATEGPALAVADVNGDGLEDVFVGGAKAQESLLFVQQKSGEFRAIKLAALSDEMQSDCIDAAFFDADMDHDQDLYIVKGGNELAVGDSSLYDVLLINNGKGNFTISKGLSLISHNGSCVEAEDYDMDGDPDLFVGSRSIPGAYGLSPQQYLLENDGRGNFSDVTEVRAKDLKNAGMVTGATWFDYDADGDSDLAVSGEWMKIRLFRNEKGIFTDVTGPAGLDSSAGWWYSLKAADVDSDGDMDLIGGNLGLNTLLKGKTDEPVELVLGDFDNSGSLDQIITAYRYGKSYPVASLDELSAQISGLDKKFSSYRDFAGKNISEIFGQEAMQRTFRKKAVVMESSLFINNGKGSFNIQLLPSEAQFSVVRDIIAEDFDKDGILDLLICGNHYTIRPTFGRYDASYGWLLKGSTDAYNALWPSASGLAIDGDARKMEIIEIGGSKYLVIVVNDGPVQLFNLSESHR